jgi:hypothetical protein
MHFLAPAMLLYWFSLGYSRARFGCAVIGPEAVKIRTKGNSMRKLKSAMAVAVLGISVFSGNRLAAFPLTLTSLTGAITATAQYGGTAATTTSPAEKVSVTLNHVITVLSNDVFVTFGTNAPEDMRIALDPFNYGLYLTNKFGFFFDIAGNKFGNFRIRDIATTFNTTNHTEQDVIVLDLSFNGNEPGGQTFVYNLRGSATFTFTVNSVGVSTASLSCRNGTGYGETNSSASGVAVGAFKAAGSGVPEWTGPYSVYWVNNL